MSWWKAIIVGLCVYWGIFLVGFVLFVCLGLGYSFSNLANALSEVLAFPAGTGKNSNLFLSMFSWTVVIAVVIKITIFYIPIK